MSEDLRKPHLRQPSIRRPLRNKTVLLVSSRQKSEKLIAGLKKLGARVLFLPAIEIRELSDKRPIDRALAALEDYAWIIFTSSYGVEHFLRRMTARAVPIERWQDLKVCAIGPSTAAQLERAGIPVSLIPENFAAEGVVDAFAKLPGGLRSLRGRRILIPRARTAREEIPEKLSAAGARVEVVPCYENVLPKTASSIVRSIAKESVDLLVFTSSSAATNAAHLLGKRNWRKLTAKATLAAIGPITARTLVELGYKVHIVPPQNSSASLLGAIKRYYAPL